MNKSKLETPNIWSAFVPQIIKYGIGMVMSFGNSYSTSYSYFCLAIVFGVTLAEAVFIHRKKKEAAASAESKKCFMTAFL